MRLVVKKYMNARSGNPLTTASIAGTKDPGDILKIDNIVVGTAIDGNSVWYHCKDDGLYYWSGGLESTTELLEDRPDGDQFTVDEQMAIYRSAVNELIASFQHIQGVTGMGAGLKSKGNRFSNKIALIFYIDRASPPEAGKIPEQIAYRGYLLNTDTRPIEKISLQGIPPDAGPSYTMGGSISDITDTSQPSAGTRTLVVNRGDHHYLLSCYHVACYHLFQQKKYDLDTQACNVSIPSAMISPANSRATYNVVEGHFSTTIDYALIEIDESDVGTKFANFMSHYQIQKPYSLEEIQKLVQQQSTVVKYGAVSLESTGTLVAFHTAGICVDKKQGLFMSGLIEATDMSEPGDSGAPVIDPSNSRLIGFIVAGAHNVSPFATYILPFVSLGNSINF